MTKEERARTTWGMATGEYLDPEGLAAMLAFADEELERAAKVAVAFGDPIEATDHENRCFGHIATAIRSMKGEG